eukprot:1701528-Pleurochrysis_carterae.AAC.1
MCERLRASACAAHCRSCCTKSWLECAARMRRVGVSPATGAKGGWGGRREPVAKGVARMPLPQNGWSLLQSLTQISYVLMRGAMCVNAQSPADNGSCGVESSTQSGTCLRRERFNLRCTCHSNRICFCARSSRTHACPCACRRLSASASRH